MESIPVTQQSGSNFVRALECLAKKESDSFGPYQVRWGKVWRGGKVVCYLEGEVLVSTKHTTNQELRSIDKSATEADAAQANPLGGAPGEETPPSDNPDPFNLPKAPGVADDETIQRGKELEGQFGGDEEEQEDIPTPQGEDNIFDPKMKHATRKPGRKATDNDLMPGMPKLTMKESVALNNALDCRLFRSLTEGDSQVHVSKVGGSFRLKTTEKPLMYNDREKGGFVEGIRFTVELVTPSGNDNLYDYHVRSEGLKVGSEAIFNTLKSGLSEAAPACEINLTTLRNLSEWLAEKMEAKRTRLKPDKLKESKKSVLGDISSFLNTVKDL